MTPLEFLQLLWQDKTPALYILLWTLSDKTSHWFRDISSAAAFIEQGRAMDVYVGVGLSKSDNGPAQRSVSDQVTGIAGFWADFDLRSDAHNKKPLSANIEEALTIVPPDLPPTIVISSGNGVHAWWLFEKPWLFASAQENAAAAALSGRFQTLLQYNSTQRGWAFDRLGDLARVLRLPGTINGKDPKKPKPVEVYSTSGSRYTPEGIREYLDRAAVPNTAVDERAKAERASYYSESPISIDLQASIPDELLSKWLSGDSRFRRTWHRERDGMPDQSSSGYDMALACFGVRSGLTDQEIVNLIIQHRRVHSDQQRKTVDYFQRTIAKARKTEDAPPLGTPTSELTDTGDQVVMRARLCEEISSALGVHILRLRKLPSSEPVFLMELESGTIEFSIATLTSQRAVRLAIGAKTSKLIPTFKRRHWEDLTQSMLNACTVVETTDDLQSDGAARVYLNKYLSDCPALPSVDNVCRRDIYKPLIYRGKLTIHTTELHNYLSQSARNVPIQRLAAMLTALGAQPIRVREGAFRDQQRWALPADEFPPRDFCDRYQDGPTDVA